MKRNLLIPIFIILILSVAGTVSALSLDTEGKGHFCTPVISINKISVKSASNQKSVYEFDGSLISQPGGSEAACPPPVLIKGTGEWIPSISGQGGTSFEEILINSQYGGGKVLKDTCNCDKNPWLYSSPNCKPVEVETGYAEFKPEANYISYPASASKLNQQQTYSLQQEEKNKTVIVFSPPELVLPDNKTSYFLPASINVKATAKENPPLGIIFGFTYRKEPKPGEWPEVPQDIQGVTLDNVVKNGLTTTGTFNVGKEGIWGIKARVNFPNSPWSTICEITIKKPMTIPGNLNDKKFKKIPYRSGD